MIPTTRSFNFNTAPAIKFGSGMLGESITELLRIMGENILLVTDSGLTRLGLYGELIEGFESSAVNFKVFDDIEADPSSTTLLNCVKVGADNRSTGVIGFGGGSSMDVAKLTALILGSKEKLEDIWGVGKATGPRLPLCLIPTTAGTGSEVTPVSIITTGKTEKKGVVSPFILPDLAIVDPALTEKLPANITAATGVDAMVHAIEAYTSKNANNNHISRSLSKESLMLLGGAIKSAVFDGSDVEAREKMLLGSMLAGIAFANSPVAAVHALAYPLGGIFKIPHGLSNALVLPEVLRFNLKIPPVAESYAELGQVLFPGLKAVHNVELAALRFSENLKKLCLDLGLPVRLRDLDIPKKSCVKLAAEAMKQTRLLVNNPRRITENDALEIYYEIW